TSCARSTTPSRSRSRARGQAPRACWPTLLDGGATMGLAYQLDGGPDAQRAEVVTYRDALLCSMHGALAANPDAILLGQGVDDHKGIFGSTRGLAEEFGSERVLDTPLAEEGLTGIAVGAALNGLYPIQTHIRADFALLAMNQIVNLAAKYRYMFG